MKKHVYFLILSTILMLFTISGCGTNQTELNENNGANATTETKEEKESNQDSNDEIEQEEIQQQKENASSEPQDLEEVDESKSTDKNTDEAPRDGPSSDLKVHYIDVGQADATLLQFESYTVLIDAGDWNSNNVVNYLHAQNIAEIDIVIGTHPDADHIGQLDKVIKQFEVGEVWLSGNTSTSKTFERVLRAIDTHGVDYDEPRTGDVFDVGALKVEILHPNRITGKANQESISLKLTYGETTFIFTGDAEIDQEQIMMRSGIDLDADILQLGHHGSKTSTSRSFLEAVSPEVTIYSAGANNSYGHPHDEVINTVKNYGASIYGTDVHGTIIVTTDGDKYAITTREDGNISPSGSNKTDQTPTSSKQPDQTSTVECVNINDASVEEVQEIIHIGPARAKDLVDLRPYSSLDDLTDISGIGPARVEDIKTEGIACIGG